MRAITRSSAITHGRAPSWGSRSWLGGGGRGRVRGVMTMAFSLPTDLEEGALRALELLADQTAIALENARLFETIDTERRRLRLLFDTTRERSTSLDQRGILEGAVRQI